MSESSVMATVLKTEAKNFVYLIFSKKELQDIVEIARLDQLCQEVG